MKISLDLSSNKVNGICIGKPCGVLRSEDAEEEKIRNINYAASLLGLNPQTDVVRPVQRHTANVGIAKTINGGSGIVRVSDFDNTDALITNEPGLGLAILHADCGSIALYDSVRNAIAMIHSGRVGTQLNIVQNTINLMQETYDSNPKDIRAFLSPCVCSDCYEVDEKTAAEYEKEFPPEVRSSFVSRYPDRKPHIDIEKTIIWELKNAGVPEDNIKTSGICTCENNNFYSYRAGDKNLRNVSLLMMKRT